MRVQVPTVRNFHATLKIHIYKHLHEAYKGSLGTSRVVRGTSSGHKGTAGCNRGFVLR